MLPEYPKASLGGIPEEIFLNIATCLQDDRDALAKLCRTGRRCRQIAEAVLYERIGVPFGDHKGAHAICRWLPLAKNVRTCCYLFNGSVENKSDRDAYFRVFENAHHIRCLIWKDSSVMFGVRTEAYGQTCLELLNKTVALFNRAVNQPFGPHNRFTQLTKLHIDAHGLWLGHFPMETLSSLFQLPVLISLRLEGFNQTTPLRNWIVPASTSPVQELHLEKNFIEIPAIAQMIASIKTLKRFGYDYYPIPLWTFEEEKDEFSITPKHSWKLLSQALRQHRDFLERLDVNHPHYLEIHLSNKDLGVLGFFADFLKLKTLQVPIEALFEAETGENDFSLYLLKQLETFNIIVQSIDTDTLLSYLPTIDVLWSHTHDRRVQVYIDFENLSRIHVRRSLRLLDVLETLCDPKIAMSMGIGFYDFALYDVVNPDFPYESDTEESEERSGEEGGEGEDEGDNSDEGDGSEEEDEQEDVEESTT